MVGFCHYCSGDGPKRLHLKQTKMSSTELDGLVLPHTKAKAPDAERQSAVQRLATVAYDDASRTYRFLAPTIRSTTSTPNSRYRERFLWSFTAGRHIVNTMHLPQRRVGRNHRGDVCIIPRIAAWTSSFTSAVKRQFARCPGSKPRDDRGTRSWVTWYCGLVTRKLPCQDDITAEELKDRLTSSEA